MTKKGHGVKIKSKIHESTDSKNTAAPEAEVALSSSSLLTHKNELVESLDENIRLKLE